MVKIQREIPWCTVICVTVALISHTCVLIGNLETSSALASIGKSTGGWSKVGVGIGRAFKEELDIEMSVVTAKLTEALAHIGEVTEGLDSLVSMVGGSADNATKEAQLVFMQMDSTTTRHEHQERPKKTRAGAKIATPPPPGSTVEIPAPPSVNLAASAVVAPPPPRTLKLSDVAFPPDDLPPPPGASNLAATPVAATPVAATAVAAPPDFPPPPPVTANLAAGAVSTPDTTVPEANTTVPPPPEDTTVAPETSVPPPPNEPPPETTVASETTVAPPKPPKTNTTTVPVVADTTEVPDTTVPPPPPDSPPDTTVVSETTLPPAANTTLAPTLEPEAKCAWRQTGGCTPTGPLEADGDKSCSETIPNETSGFCDCNGNGEKDWNEPGYDCSSSPGTCDNACKAAAEETTTEPAATTTEAVEAAGTTTAELAASTTEAAEAAGTTTAELAASTTEAAEAAGTTTAELAASTTEAAEAAETTTAEPVAHTPGPPQAKCSWRQTAGCTPDGELEPDGDKACSETIPKETSGFCDCNGDGEKDSNEPGFDCSSSPGTCDDACKAAETTTAEPAANATEAAEAKCSWRQTAGCTPDGELEPDGDKACSETIPKETSGFCDCNGNGEKDSNEPGFDCSSSPGTCDDACKAAETTTAEPVANTTEAKCSWRQTAGCTPDGELEPDGDKSCSEVIPIETSGFCDCNGNGEKDSNEPGFDCSSSPGTCDDACKAAETTTAEPAANTTEAAEAVAVTTATTQAVAAGATTIPIADTTGLSPGMSLTISDGNTSETKTIVGVNVDAAFIRQISEMRRAAPGIVTVDSPVQNNFTAGATITATPSATAARAAPEDKEAVAPGNVTAAAGNKTAAPENQTAAPKNATAATGNETTAPGNATAVQEAPTTVETTTVTTTTTTTETQFPLVDNVKIEKNVTDVIDDITDELGEKFNRFVKKFVNEKVRSTMDKAVNLVVDKLEMFLIKMQPVLKKVGEWLTKFGDKILSAIEGFSGTLDNVQKIFDKVMGALASGKPDGITGKMVHDTYTLMDLGNTGFVRQSDLENVGKMYGIDALQGAKPAELVKKFDSNKDGVLDVAEYTLAMQDESITGAMDVVLRAYTKKLSEVAGRVKKAKMRDELSKSIVNYLQLVCAKNQTKMSWVSQMLTNQTLPIEFTADVLIQLALADDDPNVLTTADVGLMVITEMTRLNANYAMKAFDRMANQTFFSEEGFDPGDYSTVVKRVTAWLGKAQKSLEEPRLFSEDEDDYLNQILEDMPDMAHEQAESSMAVHFRERRKHKQHRHQMLVSPSANFLLHHLSGGSLASDAPVTTTAAEKAIKSGVPAKPVTLRFAQWLSLNATHTAATFQKQCFDDSSSSSSPLDSFGSDIQGLTKKITSFLKMMETWTQPGYLEMIVKSFAENVEEDVLKVVDKLIEKVLRKIEKPLFKDMKDTLANHLPDGRVTSTFDNTNNTMIPKKIVVDFKGSVLMSETQEIKLAAHNSVHKLGSRSLFQNMQFSENEMELIAADVEFGRSLSGFWDKIVTVLHSLNNMLPQAAIVLKEARVTVSGAAEQIGSVFETFETKGPTIFDTIAELWSTLWVLYFCFFFPLTALLLFYGFWASGWFGGPQKLEDIPEELLSSAEQGSYWAKARVCCRSCCNCMHTFHDTAMCFWSVIILMEVVCLLIFVISIVLNIFAGVKAMIVNGCSQVYMLNDPQICMQTLGLFKGFLKTFHLQHVDEDLTNACMQHSLLTCDAVIAKMKSSMMLTTVFSFVAAIISFQLIIESSILHERARWRRILDAMKDDEDDATF